jgi:hypothetical protein
MFQRTLRFYFKCLLFPELYVCLFVFFKHDLEVFLTMPTFLQIFYFVHYFVYTVYDDVGEQWSLPRCSGKNTDFSNTGNTTTETGGTGKCLWNFILFRIKEIKGRTHGLMFLLCRKPQDFEPCVFKKYIANNRTEVNIVDSASTVDCCSWELFI